MDKQLLNALDNLSISLEEIVKALNNKNDSSSVSSVLSSSDFSNHLIEISKSIIIMIVLKLY